MKSIFNWSGGKDSALCLHRVLQEGKYKIDTLLTTLSGTNNRVTMHGVRQELLQRQAESIGLPLTQVFLPEGIGMETYDKLMQEALTPFIQEQVTHAIYGDINLEDLRRYREEQLKKAGLEAVFPLWGLPTQQVVHDFIAAGFKAVVVCVNGRILDSSFVGRELDNAFLNDLPAGVDPCGENGEFHTFVYDGPIFQNPVKFTIGEKVYKTYGTPAQNEDNCHTESSKPVFDTGFWFCDLLPA